MTHYSTLNGLRKRLQGGHVVRYHTAPEVGANQNVAAHTWRALVILDTLWPDTPFSVFKDLLYHDIAEHQLGDLPATTKWKHKQLTNLYEAAELKELSSLGVAPNCPDKYIDRIKMSDMLELVLHCYRQIQLGNSLAEPVLKNGVNYLNDKFKDHSDFGPVASILKELEK